MSAVVATEGCFMSALLPHTQVTAYAVPSDAQLSRAPGGKLITDEAAKARRVQAQVQARLAQSRSASLSRLNGSHCVTTSGTSVAAPGWNLGPPARTSGFSSASVGYQGSRTLAVPSVPHHHSGGFSSRSAVEAGSRYRISQSAAGTTLPHLGNVVHAHGYHGAGYHHQESYHSCRGGRTRSKSLCQEQELLLPSSHWLADQEASTAATTTMMRRSPATGGVREELCYQHTFKGPSHRTISRITNRQTGGGASTLGAGLQQQQQAWVGGASVLGGVAMQRAASLHSVRSVGKGVDLADGGGSCHSNDKLGGVQGLDMATAVSYLSQTDTALQVLGAAYIQHQCYHSNDAKNQVRLLRAVPLLVLLFSSESPEVQRFATGATRNLIYENMENKTALMDAGGIASLVSALTEPDEELRKNITGILWNLSSKDSLKEKLARETLSELTSRVLVPLCSPGDSGCIGHSSSEADIFYNTTGCLRNLSSVSLRCRQQMRETVGLLDSLVAYVQQAIQDERVDDKGVENSVCILRNLSYQLYSEMSPSTLLRLEGPTRGGVAQDSALIGCFTPESKKAKERRNQELSCPAEALKAPRGSEWLWHPLVVGLYNGVLQQCETNAATREAAAGALQNVTAGETRWAGVLVGVVLDQERMLPLLLDLLQTQSDSGLRPLSGLLRNLARHCRSKDHMATKAVRVLVARLPSDGQQTEPSSEVVVNLCAALNSLVAGSSLAARDICYFDGVPKLTAIKTSHDNSPGRLKAAKAASTVLSNMFQYNKLHKDYKQKGFTRRDFVDASL